MIATINALLYNVKKNCEENTKFSSELKSKKNFINPIFISLLSFGQISNSF